LTQCPKPVVRIRRDLFIPDERWRVTAFGDVDPDWVILSGDQIVAFQRAAQPTSLYTDYGIVLLEPFAPLEYFDGNRVTLYALGAARKASSVT